MKQALILILVTSLQHLAFSQQVPVISNPGMASGRSITREPSELTRLLALDQSQFESLMRGTGCNIQYDDKYCPIAAEQIGRPDMFGGEHFLVSRCENYAYLLWYGSADKSGMRNIRNKLMPYSIGRREGSEGFLVPANGRKYLFTLERKVLDASRGAYYEKLFIHPTNEK